MNVTCEVLIEGEAAATHHTFMAVPRAGETVFIGLRDQKVEVVVANVQHHSQAALGGGAAPTILIVVRYA